MENARIAQLVEFLKSEPDDSFLNYALAIEYVGMGKDADAKDLFIKVKTTDEGYVATYYHLGKLYEREENLDEAIVTYKQGINIAQQKGDRHALSELKGALMEINDDDDEDW